MAYMRTRETGGFQDTIRPRGLWTSTGHPNSTVSYVDEVIGLRYGASHKCVDVSTPGFKRRSREGEFFNSPLDIEHTTWSYTPKYWKWLNNGVVPSGQTKAQDGWNHRTLWSPADFASESVPYSTDSMATLAATQCRANIAPPDVLGLVDLAEIKQTLKMLMNPLGAFTDIARTLNRKSARKRKSFSDRYLEYRYGWTPLLGSISGLIEALTKERSDIHTARAYVNPGMVTNTATKPVSDWMSQGTISMVTNVTHKWRAGCRYKHTTNLEHDLGLSLSSLPATLVDLTTLSFVADWFFNVADYVSAITPKTGVEIQLEWLVYKGYVMRSSSMTCSAKTVSGYTITGAPGCDVVHTYEHKTRVPWLPPSGLVATPPFQWGKPSDMLHLADALALIGGYLRR